MTDDIRANESAEERKKRMDEKHPSAPGTTTPTTTQ